MKTVWVIEQGSYSDYSVVGVFTSKEDAELVLAAIDQSYERGSMSEWPLNPGVDELRQGKTMWRVLMLKDGTVESIHSTKPASYFANDVPSVWRRSKCSGAFKADDALQCSVWAKDSKHAIKIANEIRAQKIAEGEWK